MGRITKHELMEKLDRSISSMAILAIISLHKDLDFVDMVREPLCDSIESADNIRQVLLTTDEISDELCEDCLGMIAYNYTIVDRLVRKFQNLEPATYRYHMCKLLEKLETGLMHCKENENGQKKNLISMIQHEENRFLMDSISNKEAFISLLSIYRKATIMYPRWLEYAKK